MAIAFVNLTFAHLLPDGGACQLLAYNTRCPVHDRRLGRTFDFSNLAADLVEEHVIAPDGIAPPESVEAFANAVDEAEAKHVRLSLDRRKRRPQVGGSIIVALPPDTELALDEIIEIPCRMAEHVRDGQNLLFHLALHDPALLIPGAATRHGHLLMPMREWQGEAFGGRKLRNLFARVRQSTEPTPRRSFVAEGVDWPSLSWEVQQTLFTECATDLVVDPIAPHSEPHWNPRFFRDKAACVRERAAIINRLNIEAVEGDAAGLVAKLLRRRSTVTAAELKRLIARFIGEDDRDGQLNAVLGHEEIVGLTPEVGGAPRFVTTRAIHDQLIHATTLVDRAAEVRDTPRIRAISASDHDGVATAIRDLLTSDPLGRSARTPRPLFIGLRRSDAEQAARAVPFARPAVATIAEVLDTRTKRSRERNRPKLRVGGLVVVPRAEQVADQDLARLLRACDAEDVTVVLGHDQSRRSGVVANRLAAYAAEMLAAMPVPARPGVPDQAETAHLLRAGLIGPAIEAMAPMLTFAPVEAAAADGSQADFVVCDDPRRLAETNIRLADIRADEASIEVKTRHGRGVLHEGEWIAFTETDYSVRPPRIRAGRLAQIVAVDRTLNGIHVSLPCGECERIDLDAFPHVRPAHAISIREARQISWPCELRVEITSAKYAWAGLLLACGGTRWPSVIVDPNVACDAAELTAVVRANLPGALSNDLSIAPRPDAIDIWSTSATSNRVADVEIERITDFFPIVPEVSDGEGVPTFGIEPMDRPSSTGPSNDTRVTGPSRKVGYKRTEMLAALAGLDEGLRDRIASSPDAFAGFLQLRKHLAADDPERDATATRLLGLCDANGPTATVIACLMGHDKAVGPKAEAMRDFPMEMETLAPRAWTEWDLFRVKIDLATMRFQSNWWAIVEPREPIPQEEPEWEPPHP